MKGVLEAVCGLKTVELTNDVINILEIHYLYHNGTLVPLWKFSITGNFLSTVKQIPNALNIWNTRTLTLKERILKFKTLVISKIVYLSLITTVPNSILNEIQKIQKAFLWYFSKPKINYKTLCNTFKEDGLKNVDIKACSILGLKNYLMATIMIRRLFHYFL